MKNLNSIVIVSSLAGIASSARGPKHFDPCPPLKGHVTVKVPDIYPEGADFALSSCKFYLGSVCAFFLALSPYPMTPAQPSG